MLYKVICFKVDLFFVFVNEVLFVYEGIIKSSCISEVTAILLLSILITLANWIRGTFKNGVPLIRIQYLYKYCLYSTSVKLTRIGICSLK